MDVAYAVYRWIPFVSPKNPDYCYNLDEQIRRLKLFVGTYGLKNNEREQLPGMIIERISSLVSKIPVCLINPYYNHNRISNTALERTETKPMRSIFM